MKQHSLNVFIQLLHINVNALEVRIKVFFKDKNLNFLNSYFTKTLMKRIFLISFTDTHTLD